jgi:very-short-patch-repair endonuclease
MKYLTTTPEKWKLLKPLLRENRIDMTFAEKIIWNIVRKNQLGVKFRRQQAIADYIVDFVCLDIKLIIEIDGVSHAEQKEYDEYRTDIMNGLGFKVIRFTNDEVNSNGNLVEKKIKDEIQKILDSEI